MKLPAAWSLAGLFLVAAVHIASGTETKHNFGVWERDISAFERMDKTNPPPTNGIEFIGSSTIARWKTLTQDYPGRPVFNRGFGGSELADSTHFAPRIIFPYAPRMILLRAGGNDLAAGKTPEAVFSDFKDFVATVQAQLPATEIVFIAWGPTLSRWKQHDQELKLNRLVKDFIGTHSHVQYIETYDLPLGTDGKPRPELFGTDQLHYNAAGYALLAERVRPFLPK